MDTESVLSRERKVRVCGGPSRYGRVRPFASDDPVPAPGGGEVRQRRSLCNQAFRLYRERPDVQVKLRMAPTDELVAMMLATGKG